MLAVFFAIIVLREKAYVSAYMYHVSSMLVLQDIELCFLILAYKLFVCIALLVSIHSYIALISAHIEPGA